MPSVDGWRNSIVVRCCVACNEITRTWWLIEHACFTEHLLTWHKDALPDSSVNSQHAPASAVAITSSDISDRHACGKPSAADKFFSTQNCNRNSKLLLLYCLVMSAFWRKRVFFALTKARISTWKLPMLCHCQLSEVPDRLTADMMHAFALISMAIA